jgi:hypothetical protein
VKKMLPSLTSCESRQPGCVTCGFSLLLAPACARYDQARAEHGADQVRAGLITLRIPPTQPGPQPAHGSSGPVGCGLDAGPEPSNQWRMVSDGPGDPGPVAAALALPPSDPPRMHEGRDMRDPGTDGSYTPPSPSCLFGGQASHHAMGNHVSFPASISTPP